MVDFSQFFSPAAFGSWNPPPQSMLPPGGAPGQPPQTPNAPPQMHPGMMPTMPSIGAPGAGAPGGGNPAPGGPAMNLGGGLSALMDKFRNAGSQPLNIGPGQQGGQGGMMSGISGNPLLAKFGSAMMNGQNPLQAMMSNPGDFAKWAAQRRAAVPGVQANPMGPQPPVPTQNPGMLGGMY